VRRQVAPRRIVHRQRRRWRRHGDEQLLQHLRCLELGILDDERIQRIQRVDYHLVEHHLGEHDLLDQRIFHDGFEQLVQLGFVHERLQQLVEHGVVVLEQLVEHGVVVHERLQQLVEQRGLSSDGLCSVQRRDP
jgi:hypothetical protein